MQYSQYWRRYFDPIVIRLQVTPKQYRAETIILPLIDNSIYTGMAMALGGEPEPLDALPVPKKNIFSMALRVNKQELLKQGAPFLHEIEQHGTGSGEKMPNREEFSKSVQEFLQNGIGNQIALNIYDASPMFDFNLTRFLGEMMGEFRGVGSHMSSEMIPISFLVSSLNSPVYVSVPVKDEKVVDKFLEDLDQVLAMLARQKDRGGWFRSRLRLLSRAGRRQIARPAVLQRAVRADEMAGVFRADRRRAVHRQQEVHSRRSGRGVEDCERKPAGETRSGPTAHAMVRVRPENWKETLPDFQLGWAEGSREACLNNLGPLSSVARAVASQNGGKAEDRGSAARGRRPARRPFLSAPTAAITNSRPTASKSSAPFTATPPRPANYWPPPRKARWIKS